tara:strand:- start:246 stop:776 length:531 start_codon:yes stop_codon:yes gene_type:complete
MKISKNKLRQIIREEYTRLKVRNMLNEIRAYDPPTDAYRPKQGSGMDKEELQEIAEGAFEYLCIYYDDRKGHFVNPGAQNITTAIREAIRKLDPDKFYNEGGNDMDVKALYFEITDMYGGPSGFRKEVKKRNAKIRSDKSKSGTKKTGGKGHFEDYLKSGRRGSMTYGGRRATTEY